MILHMLSLLMLMVMVNSVISAPGQIETMKDEAEARKGKPRPQSSGTLDSIGGGHLLGAESTDTIGHNFFRSLKLLASYENDIPQKMILITREEKPSSSGTLDFLVNRSYLTILDPDQKTDIFKTLESLLGSQDNTLQNVVSSDREDKQKPSSSGTLDPIGGGNLVKVDESRKDTKFFESLLDNQDDILQNMILLAREDKQKPSPSGTLDPIGGDNLVKVDESRKDTKFFESLLDNQDDILQNVILLAHEDKQKPSSSGTLDPIGGGNILRIDESRKDAEFLESLLDNQDNMLQNMISLARDDKQKSSSSGTLDPIGGGNLVRIDDSRRDTEFLESLLDNQDNILQNMVSLALKDKQKHSSSGTLDSIGGGNLLRAVGTRNDDELFESFLDEQAAILKNMVSLAHEDKQKHSSSGTLDPLGGDNFVRIVDPHTEKMFYDLLEPFNKNEDMVAVARADKQKPASSGTLDPIGGGNLVRIVDPDADKEFLDSLDSFNNNEDDMLQHMVSAAREEKQKPSSSGTLDPIGGGNLVRVVDPNTETKIFNSLQSLVDNQGRQNMMRLAREDKSTQRSTHALDGLGGGHIAGLADPYRGPIFRSHLVDSLDQGGDVLRMLDSISGSELLSSLDSAEGMAVLSALRKTHTKYPKRMLDSVSGWAFGESKRNFDEIDNVGFNGFAKRSPRYRQLALAKKNFDEIDRAGFETYNKRDFDEIDRAGFETFEKRDRKE